MAGDFFREIATALLPHARALVPQWLPGGRLDGTEWVVRNPKRHDKKPGSFRINTQTGQWADFATGEKGGDLISLYAWLNNMPQKDAATQLAKDHGTRNAPPPPKRKRAPRPADYATRKLPEIHPVYGKPDRRFVYKQADGTIFGWNCRWEGDEHTKKVIRPLSPALMYLEKKNRWDFWGMPPGKRPLYRLMDMLQPEKANGNVVIVEGEKAAEAGARSLKGTAASCITWMGGGSAMEFADWSPVRGRNCIIIPDDDLPGRATACKVAELVIGAGGKAYIADPGDRGNEGWDIADWVGADGNFLAWIKERSENTIPLKDYYADVQRQIEEAAELRKTKGSMPKAPPPAEAQPPPPPPDSAPEPPLADDQEPFWVLGYVRTNDDGTRYVFYSKESGSIVYLPASKLTKADLRTLAPFNWWRQRYPSKSKAGTPSWDLAAEAIVREGNRKGMVSVHELRHGRGAFIHRKERKLYINLGNRVLTPTDILGNAVASRPTMLFERGDPISVPDAPPLTAEGGRMLLKIAHLPPWQHRARSANLLAGWVAIAPFCGALPWRPHLFLTGSTGTGKSTIITHYVQPLLGRFALMFEGKSSEPGIRRAIASDTLPLTYDESERGKNRFGESVMQEILQLARVASSESGGFIRHGDGKVYRPRSMFFFVATQSHLNDAADKNRFSVLATRSVAAGENRANWEQFLRQTQKFTGETHARIFWRMYHKFYSFQKALILTRSALRDYLDDARLADHFAPMLAATHTLTNDEDLEAAGLTDYFDSLELKGLLADMQSSDEISLLNDILGFRYRLTPASEVPIGELVQIARDTADYNAADNAERALRRAGFIINGNYLIIANKTAFLQEKIERTQWGGANTASLLRSIKGARVTQNSLSFSGTNSRGVAVPLKEVLAGQTLSTGSEDIALTDDG